LLSSRQSALPGDHRPRPCRYLLENDHILINTSEGRKKLQNLKANPRVALTIVDPDDPYRYVQIQGKVVNFDRERGALDIDRLSMRYRGRAHRYRPADGPEKRVSILIQPVRYNTDGIK